MSTCSYTTHLCPSGNGAQAQYEGGLAYPRGQGDDTKTSKEAHEPDIQGPQSKHFCSGYKLNGLVALSHAAIASLTQLLKVFVLLISHQ